MLFSNLPSVLFEICEDNHPMAFFKVEDLSIQFGGLKALDGISFEVQKGDLEILARIESEHVQYV